MHDLLKDSSLDDAAKERLRKDFEKLHSGSDRGVLTTLKSGVEWVRSQLFRLSQPQESSRRKVMTMCPDTLLGLGKRAGITTVGAPVPLDAKVVHRYFDERGDLCLVVESETFPEVSPGSLYCYMEDIRLTAPCLHFEPNK